MSKNFLTPSPPLSPLEDVRPMAFRRADGKIELVHPYTGQVLAVQSDATTTLENTPDRYRPVELPNGEVRYLDKSLDVGVFGRPQKSWSRNTVVEDLICQRISEGEILADICSTPGFPSLTIYGQWMKDPEFKSRIFEARALRAETLKEQVLVEADLAISEALPEQSVPARKVKIDALKWVASVDSPDRFGSKTKVEQSVSSTIMVIDTGIRRDDLANNAGVTAGADAGFIDVTNDAGLPVMSILPKEADGEGRT